MVLIITEKADFSTNLVIDWLCFFNLKWIRINENDGLDLNFVGNDIEITVSGETFLLSEIKSVWYRRGGLKIKFNPVDDLKINMMRKSEISKIHEYMHYKISLLPHINSFTTSDVNKLIVSDIARKCNIKTPKDFIFSKKKYLGILDSKQQYSTKSITGSSILEYEKILLIDYTIKLDNVDKMNASFFPSLVQNYISKKYELRIFYLHKKFWAMAIFSQKDLKTNIDFRNYNGEKPNRNVPFNLPSEIKSNLTELMNKLNLNSGSIDMIVTPDNEFVFLEVNPIGQFGMVSNPCNYYLHKEIAFFLKQNHYD